MDAFANISMIARKVVSHSSSSAQKSDVSLLPNLPWESIQQLQKLQ